MKKISFSFQGISTILAITLSVIAIYVSWRQLRIYENQLKSSVWPYLELRYVQRDNVFKIVLTNQGVGPAVIQSTSFRINGKDYSQIGDFAEKELQGISKVDIAYTGVGKVVSANETIELVRVKSDSLEVNAFRNRLELNDFRIIYASIYNECWDFSGKGIVSINCKK